MSVLRSFTRLARPVLCNNLSRCLSAPLTTSIPTRSFANISIVSSPDAPAAIGPYR